VTDPGGRTGSAGITVTVRYVFGLACGPEARPPATLGLPTGSTLFEALQRLGMSTLELHAAVNGTSARDGTVLADGDEVILIPAIQGGAPRRRAGAGGRGAR
jgi:sulfur carrier protein ThiS